MQKIKETKYNEWFRNVFLESFGICDQPKQVTEKQGMIFQKYLREEKDNCRRENAFYYSGIISGKKVRLQESRVYNGCTKGHTKTLYRGEYFVIIKPDNTEKENNIRQRIKDLNDQWNLAFESGASDKELDDIEDKIDELYIVLNSLRF